jgi:protocatechuate 4,5-dioxygenase alpha chain
MCNSSLPVGISDGLPRRGELINQLCGALADPAERRDFYLNEDAFCLRFGLDRTARLAVKDRDYLRLIDLGGHVAKLDQLAALSGLSTLEAIRMRTGVSASALFGELLDLDG